MCLHQIHKYIHTYSSVHHISHTNSENATRITYHHHLPPSFPPKQKSDPATRPLQRLSRPRGAPRQIRSDQIRSDQFSPPSFLLQTSLSPPSGQARTRIPLPPSPSASSTKKVKGPNLNSSYLHRINQINRWYKKWEERKGR
jgi:hypothetical protein